LNFASVPSVGVAPACEEVRRGGFRCSQKTAMLEKVLQLLSIACAHRKLSKPFTSEFDSAYNTADWMPVGHGGPSHYVVCLDCGKKFGYDWRNMKVLR